MLPLDDTQAADRELLAKIGRAMDGLLLQLNATNSPVQKERRINEVCAHFGLAIRHALNRVPGFACDDPKKAQGRIQRQDIRIFAWPTGPRVACHNLDPRLSERGSRHSPLRTFHCEPKAGTGSSLVDADHVIVVMEHDGLDR